MNPFRTRSSSALARALALLGLAVTAALPPLSAQWIAKNSGLPSSERYTDLAVSDTTLLVSLFDKGVWRSTNNGDSWTATTGLAGNGLYVARLLVNGGNIFAGTATGVARSTDGGQSWQMINTGIPADNCVFAFAANGSTLYAGTVYIGSPSNPNGFVGAGVYKSIDGGATWSPANGNLPRNADGTVPGIRDLVVSGSTVIAGTSGFGTFRSPDGGATWTNITPPVASSLGSEILQPENYESGLAFIGGNLYLGTGSDIFGNGSFFRSANSGTSWTKLVSGSISLSGLGNVPAYFGQSGNTLFLCCASGFQTYDTVNGVRKEFNDGLPPSARNNGAPMQTNAAVTLGSFVFCATDMAGVYRRPLGDVAVAAAAAPTIVTQPQGQSIGVGTAINLSVVAGGNGPFTYVWRKNGAVIAGATSSTLTIPNATASDNGAYSVVVTNGSGPTTSADATVTVTAVTGGLPVITTQPANVSAAAGQSVTLTVVASGSDLRYQWFKSGATTGTALTGATNASLLLANLAASDAGSYFCVVTGSGGSTVSTSGVVSVTGGTSRPSRLSNLAIRSLAGTGSQTLIVGATIGGTGASTAKPILIRGIGPSLTQFGVTGVLTDPVLAVFSGSTVIASNDNWGGDAQVSTVGASVGAFALASATSRDAALFNPAVPPGGYSVQISGVGGATGVALAEVYDTTTDANFTSATPRLTNLSARTQVGTGDSILVAGFTISGDGTKTILVRAVGPGLAVFGVTGVLADPKLELFTGQTKLGENDDWGGGAPLASAAVSVGAFALSPGSKDAAMVVTLSAGSYTAQISGTGGTTGVALVEVYELP